MIDIHPPHQSVHTWKDFLIHIATIIVGLVIAIGLEQTVEFLHRVSERRALIVDLHEECARNMDVLRSDIAALTIRRAWMLAVIETLNRAQPQNGIVTVSLPQQSTVKTPTAPSRSVWSVAKSNGRVALLPENIAEVYDRVDHEGDEFFSSNRDTMAARIPLRELATRLGVQLTPGATLSLSIADRDDLVRAYCHALAVQDAFTGWAQNWAAASQAALDGVQNRAEIDRYFAAARKKSNL